MVKPILTLRRIRMRDIYQTVTDRIVQQLEAGTAPWMKPWSSAGPTVRPLRSTGQPYNGVNVLTLWLDTEEKGFSSPYWFGFQTALKMGAHVRKGEKGSMIVYANKTIKTEENPKTGEEETRAIPFLKQSFVFNAGQIDGLPEHFYQVAPATPHRDPSARISRLDDFFRHTGANIRHGGSRAFYQIDADFVQMPAFADFYRGENYYATLAHEMTHWSRHPKRLDRDMGRKTWGDASYAMEELVAEMGAAFLCADLGITPETREDHAAYIASWLEVLKGDKRAIFTAASKASKAAEYLQSLVMPEQVAA
jgi:antirestriction protein ArdC